MVPERSIILVETTPTEHALTKNIHNAERVVRVIIGLAIISLVFIGPPSLEQLEARLRGRGTDDAEAVAKRLQTAHEELASWRSYDYLVINDQLETAVADLAAIVRARRLQTPAP